MSGGDSTPNEFGENNINLKLPVFGISNPRVWFTQVEAFFRFRKITSQPTMFSYVATQLPTDIASEVIDVLDPMPEENPYDKIKAAVLKRTMASDESRLQQLLSGVELGDRTPSQLLRHMRSLVGNARIDDTILKQLWCKCLPANTNAILSTQGDAVSLEKLAETADKVHECFFKSSTTYVNQVGEASTNDRIDKLLNEVAQLKLTVDNIVHNRDSRWSRSNRFRHRPISRSKSRSKNKKSNTWCYYHSKFGNKANICKKPCTFPDETEQGNIMASQ